MKMDSSWNLVGTLKVPIYYEDTDFTGYVFHPNYLKYFDRARECLFGLELLAELYKDNVHFVVKSANLNYLRPATHGQTIVVATEVQWSQSPKIEFRQIAYFGDDTQSRTTLVTGAIELVTVNDTGYPIRQPQRIIDRLQERSLDPFYI